MKNYYFDGLDAFKKGNYPQAIFLFKKSLEENPEEYEGLFFLGEALFLTDAFHDAIEYLTNYIHIAEKISYSLKI
jgi:tetratricopeptide (TPR) repeat protein